MSDNDSQTNYHRPKSVQKWINSSDLRARWYGRKCPICGCGSLVYKLGRDYNTVEKVGCFECDWEVEK